MFAGAAREVVFANPEVVRRVNEEFIPVALKAGLVNNPPGGPEGRLYAEIGRSKPAPQGICTANSAGKVLAWALSFDDTASILGFLDHVGRRYRENPDASKRVTAERFHKFPGRPLTDVADTQANLVIPVEHVRETCPAEPRVAPGTLVGRIIGRALDDNGKPVADTIRQEHYMEARLEIPVTVQRRLAEAATQSGMERFQVPDDFVRVMVSPAYLGQLDVSPCGTVPGSTNDGTRWEFHGQRVESGDQETIRIRVDGRSHVSGGQAAGRSPRGDGRMWEHRVKLSWHGFIDLRGQRAVRLVLLADGDERLRWGNARFNLVNEADVEHLMAGHAIDLDCGVRYGLFAEIGEAPSK